MLEQQRRRLTRPGGTGRSVLAPPLAGLRPPLAGAGGGGGGGEGGAGLWQRGGAQRPGLKRRVRDDALRVWTQPGRAPPSGGSPELLSANAAVIKKTKGKFYNRNVRL